MGIYPAHRVCKHGYVGYNMLRMVVDTYHPVVGKIKELLDVSRVWYEEFEHAPVRTSEEAG